ncbi:nicotinamide-nucleotide adenylyltransferase [Halocalculus aciditolerans]|uniref:Nicotinamide-nucleotide adenylyltransferase n=1 Tax=Halocalculus aciditolerans TaxID=1383812 RepID=A0A830FP18_9EURY|nr:nicotinamide-nucleotide adenylyltransferase [Halocalculus aciditolerans]GGL72250.1 nicotinamide-nucleotide adenylyltransferase [Halocalculus aciditolerans]
MRRGFYIGRFQPFHDGHYRVVEEIAADVDELVLGIGSAGDSHSTHDPFTAGERIMMIRQALADHELTVYAVPIEDLDRNAVWVSHVQSMTPEFDVAYSNNPLVVRLFEEKGVRVEGSPMFERDVLEGTEIRERMVRGDDWAALVPDAVAAVIREVGGVERITQVAETDTSIDE